MTPMPTALTHMEASTVDAYMALKEMDLTVQVVFLIFSHAVTLVKCKYISYEIRRHQYMAVVVVRSEYVST